MMMANLTKMRFINRLTIEYTSWITEEEGGGAVT